MAGDNPQPRQVGRYLFYGLCAFGLSLFAHAASRMLHLPEWLTGSLDMFVMFVAFMSLRDIEKNAEARAQRKLP